MSLNVELIGGGSVTGSQSIEGGTYNVTYTTKYRVLDTSGTAGPVDVLGAAGIPDFETYFSELGSSDTEAYVTSKTCEFVSRGNVNLWHVTVTWSPIDITYQNPNPLLDQAMASWSQIKFQVPALVDQVSGFPVTNSTGDYFDPGEQIDRTRMVLTIGKNQEFFDAGVAAQYTDTVNGSPWGGFSAKTVKCTSVTCDPPLWSPIVGRYFRVNYVFEIQSTGYNLNGEPLNWQAVPVDQGMRKLVSSGGGYAWQTIIGNDGIPVSSPVLLDGSGSPLAPDPVSSLSAVFLTYDVYLPVDFHSLGIGITDLGTGPILL